MGSARQLAHTRRVCRTTATLRLNPRQAATQHTPIGHAVGDDYARPCLALAHNSGRKGERWAIAA